MAIIYPFKPRVSISVCLIIIAVIWIEAILLTIPFGWFMEQTYEQHITYCDEVWPSEQFRKSFIVSTTILQFVIPFALITYCYTKICYKLRARTRRKPGLKSARKKELEREKTKRTNRMLISMVLIFGASWLPLNLYNLIQDFYAPASGWSYARVFFLLTHAIAMSSTCYNPFLYAWLNETFRKEFKKVLPCFSIQNDRDVECIVDEVTTNKRRSQHVLSGFVDDIHGESTFNRHRSTNLTGDDGDATVDFTQLFTGEHEVIQMQEKVNCHLQLQVDASVIVNVKTIDTDGDDDREINITHTREHNEDGARVLTNVNSDVPDVINSST